MILMRRSIGMERIRGGVGVISDEMAYREYLEGREESADILVDRYGDALTYYINGYIHDIHESEDLMIEAFAMVLRRSVRLMERGVFELIFIKQREI